MRFTLWLVFLAIAISGRVASADVFRCIGKDGEPRFVDRAHACEEPAEPHPLSRRLQRVPAPAGSPAKGATPLRNESLAEVLLSAHEVSGWEVVGEVPIVVSRDPDLVRWGVTAQLTRHYTRDTEDDVRVCSVEVWSFESAPQAQTAHEHFAFPGWRIDRAGPLLVMVRGLIRSERGRKRGVFEACGRLGDRIQTRAAHLTSPP